jgi:hypothetical protein
MTHRWRALRTAVALGGAVVLSAAVLAAAAEPSPAVREDLQQRADQLDLLASATKGAPKADMLMQRDQINQILADIEAGRSVDPADVDRLLRYSR